MQITAAILHTAAHRQADKPYFCSMAGIYLHIPFCKKACHYCDFHFSTSLQYKSDVLEALHKELDLQKSYLQDAPINTIYFGGGTPSVLESQEIRALVDHITTLFSVSAEAEITLEANPDDLNPQKIKELRQTAINRFSIGTQSFFNEDLIWMNRTHTSGEAEAAIKRTQDAGFENITIDLIYGFPLLTDAKWQANIAKALSLQVPHISSYSLTVEPRTALASFIQKGKQAPLNDSQSAAQFLMLMQLLNEGGFEHYEISNFALPGMYSRHNSNYWKGVPYLGIGPSAHSFNGESRQWNVANNSKYTAEVLQGKIPAQVETLTPENRVNEYLMTSLRTIWGTDLAKIETNFGGDYRTQIEHLLPEFIEKGHLKQEGHIITLTSEGKLFADHIAAELFVEQEA